MIEDPDFSSQDAVFGHLVFVHPLSRIGSSIVPQILLSNH
jgi:hypothetical protein